MIPLVSIIIPAYNRAHLITETLDSVLAQTYQDWECIIVDDGSTDKTIEVVRHFIKNDNRFKLIIRPNDRKKGVSSCRNIGIENATCKYIQFLDSDDIISKECLEKRVEIALNNLDADGIVFSTKEFIKEIGDTNGIYNIDCFPWSNKRNLELFLQQKYVWTVLSGLWKRELFNSVLFREDIVLLEDVVLHIEFLFIENIKIIRADIVDNFYRKTIKDEAFYFSKIKEISKAYIYLIEKYHDKIISEIELKKSVSSSVKRIYFNFLIKNTNSNEIKILKEKIKIDSFLNYYEFWMIKILCFIYIRGLIDIKGVGMYKLSKRLRNKLFSS